MLRIFLIILVGCIAFVCLPAQLANKIAFTVDGRIVTLWELQKDNMIEKILSYDKKAVYKPFRIEKYAQVSQQDQDRKIGQVLILKEMEKLKITKAVSDIDATKEFYDFKNRFYSTKDYQDFLLFVPINESELERIIKERYIFYSYLKKRVVASEIYSAEIISYITNNPSLFSSLSREAAKQKAKKLLEEKRLREQMDKLILELKSNSKIVTPEQEITQNKNIKKQ